MADLIEAGEVARLQRRLDRERAARREAETVSERGLRRLYVREQELLLLQDIATAANLSESVRDVFQFALKRICDFMAWPLGHAYEVVPCNDGARLRSMTLWNWRDDFKATAFREASETRDFAEVDGLPGQVFRSRQPVWLVDVPDSENFVRRDEARASEIASACAFPICVGEEVVAVFEFFSERALPPDPSLLALLPQVGIHLGHTIERKRAEERLIHDASHDPLTGLPNRALFLERLNQSLAHARRKPESQFAVLFIDLDRFKVVNDSLGHLAGDRLIGQVAGRLQSALRREDLMARATAAPATDASTLARLGGDEFTILLADIEDPSDAVRVADRVMAALRPRFVVEGQDVYTSASIGIASSASGYADADAILRDADLAMYRAKALGKARWELFDRSLHQAAMNRLALETDLRRALQNEEFVLHYQPIVSLQTGEVAGFEALVRWRKPDGELVQPGDFIEIMEDTGLIVFLGAWVLREACRAARQLQTAFPSERPRSISVNVSPRQFAQPDLAQQVRAAIADAGIDPRCLRLEITEGAMIGDMQRVAAVLRELQALGVRVSIDDFGTGYSSLSYLHSLPLDLLKIDRSFVAAMVDNKESLQIVRTIMALAHNLGMDVIAEGPEDVEQVAQLREIGCEYGQGYYFSRPVDFDSAAALLARTEHISALHG